MSAIDEVFQQLRSTGQRALIPFVTAGDPDLAFTGDLVRLFQEHGCSLCELGIPYSDPIADGPVIQASYTRALERGVRLRDILGAAQSWTSAERADRVKIPLVTMVSYAIVLRQGPEQYVRQAKQSGVSGAIIPDLLIEESAQMAEICARHDFSLIQLVTPTTPRERAVQIANTSTGFLYYVSVAGITGARQELPPEVVDQVAWLREQTELPICIGFGISRPDHVRLLAPVADGLIVGSAIVRLVARADQRERSELLVEIGRFIDALRSACQLSGDRATGDAS